MFESNEGDQSKSHVGRIFQQKQKEWSDWRMQEEESKVEEAGTLNIVWEEQG